MEYTFTLYEPKKERITNSDHPLVEINPSGRIIFNQKASELLAQQDYCMLGYDVQNNVLGIMPIQDFKINSFTVRYAAKGAYIGAKKFFRFFEILPPKSIHASPSPFGEFISIPLK